MPSKDEMEAMAELTRAINGLRHALADVALLIDDPLFETDTAARARAQQLTKEWLHKTCPPGSHKDT